MAPSAPPDWRGLLMPIDATAIAGRDLRDDSNPHSIYWHTRELRDEARRLERDSADGRVTQIQLQQRWRQINDNAHEILATHSKDFDVIAWLLEAWSRLHGIQGLAAGLQLFAAFLREFWLYAFPQNESCEHPADRISAFAGLNGGSRPGTLIDAIHGIAVTAATPDTAYALWHYLNARDADTISDSTQQRQRIEALGFSLADIHAAAARTPANFYRDAITALNTAVTALQDIEETLTLLLDEHAPSTTMIRDALTGLSDTFSVLAPATAIQPQVADSHTLPPFSISAMARHHSEGVTDSSNLPGSRVDAITQLERIAQYFRRAEPHSPLACGIDKLVRWAHLPFAELMRELITDSASRTQFHLMTGVNLDDTP